jgi:hypothetical protein
MIWSLALDDFKGTMCGEGKYPLISSIKETLSAAAERGPVNSTAVVTVKPTVVATTKSPSVNTPKAGGSGSVCMLIFISSVIIY